MKCDYLFLKKIWHLKTPNVCDFVGFWDTALDIKTMGSITQLPTYLLNLPIYLT